MELWIDVKNKVHDASGIDKPENYYWDKDFNNGVYYPVKEIMEDEKHEIISDFINKNNLPKLSLDEIDLEYFKTEKLMEYRNFFISMFD